jgi:hypothetical protein
LSEAAPERAAERVGEFGDGLKVVWLANVNIQYLAVTYRTSAANSNNSDNSRMVRVVIDTNTICSLYLRIFSYQIAN